MRTAAPFIVLILFGSFSRQVAAAQDLAAALLAAKNAGERAALLQSHPADEYRAALDAIEKEADRKLAAKQYREALDAYDAAMLLAQKLGDKSRAPLYFRREGISHAILGQNEEALASYRNGAAAAKAAGDDMMLAENLHGVGNILQRTGHYREALPYCEREMALTEKLGDPDAINRALNTYSETLLELGRVREAMPLATRALEIMRKANNRTLIDVNLGNLANMYAVSGDGDTALAMLHSMTEPNSYSMDSMGEILAGLDRFDEAEASFRRAIETSAEPGVWRIHAAAILNYGAMERRRGKLAEARKLIDEGLAINRSHHDLGGTADALIELASLSIDQKDPSRAIEEATGAVASAREAGSPEFATLALTAEARALEALGRNSDAERCFRDAIEIAEMLRADTPATSAGLQGEPWSWLSVYRYAVIHEIAAGHALAALRLADRAKARVLIDMLDAGEPRFDAIADPQERAEEQQARDEVARTRLAALAKPSAATKSVFQSALHKEDEFNARLYALHPELVLQRAQPPALEANDLASLIPDRRTAIVSFFAAPDAIALFVVRGPGEVNAYRLTDRPKIEKLVRGFRGQIAARDLDYQGTARALFDALLGPAAAALRGADRWIVSPDGILWDVPFQALIDASGKHLIERLSISYAPSIGVLRELRARPAKSRAPSTALLAVANPALKGVAPIPDAGREVAEIASLYRPRKVDVLMGQQATKALFLPAASDARVVHIASHAETQPEHPLESSLLFTPEKAAAGGSDGALTARDLLGLHLNADLVVLSACETARGKIGDGDGVMGIGWAALAAGARSAILSQWRVDSAATADLMIDFHRRLAKTKLAGKADAMREAALATMRSPGRAHPFYWAGFILLGDAR